MKKIKMYHAELPNMGDLLNVLLMEEYFGVPMKRYTPLNAQLSGIGSGLGQFTLPDNKPLLSIAEKISGQMFPDVHIWGTGFIENKNWGQFYRKNMIFNAVRGELTKATVEKILGKKIEVTLGDGGILAPKLVEKGIENEKKYKVSIIPHFKEQTHVAFKELSEKFKGSHIINLRDEPHQVIREIAQSEMVISSSLHGLIVADAFYVPNYHIVVTDNLLGDGFKFDDYYSAFGLKHKYLNYGDDEFEKLSETYIQEQYEITREMVGKMQRDMFEAFPFKKDGIKFE